MCVAVLGATAQTRTGTLAIYYIDTEGGQSTLFVGPAGESLLVDTGNAGDRDLGRIADTLRTVGVTRIDYLWTTHYHGDHVGALLELAKQFPVGHFYDHGRPHPNDRIVSAQFLAAYETLSTGKRTVVKPGDKVTMSGLDITAVASANQFIRTNLSGGGGQNASCAGVKQKDESAYVDPDNGESAGFVLTYGRFRTVDLGDLTWNGELDLMCPTNRIGTVDLYLTSHHGLEKSGSPALVQALRPRVVVMNNGTRKGGTPEAFAGLQETVGIEDLWQLHWSYNVGLENAPARFIANVDEPATIATVLTTPAPTPGAPPGPRPGGPGGAPGRGPGGPGAAAHTPAYLIKVTAQQDGTFTVTNTRNGFSKTLPARAVNEGFMSWSQLYDPFGNRVLSTTVSALPVLTLFFVLVALKKRVWISALSGFAVAVALALFVFGMPGLLVGTAAVHGVIFGLMRIAWIVVGSIFLYNVACETGQFEVMKESIAGLSSDKRLQLVLIAFCFGAFLEGAGGGGAPVAIAGAFLIGLGFNPFQAATLCLIANTAPVAWGGVGNPIRTLAGVTGLPEAAFSAMAGRILPPISLILPFWLVRSMVGWRETVQVWPALLVSGASFAAMQFYWSNFQEPGLVDIVAAVFSLLVMVAFLKVWQPPVVMLVDGGSATSSPRMPRVPSNVATTAVSSPVVTRHSAVAVLKGWSPFIIASVLIFVTALPAIARYLNVPALSIPMPLLHRAVLKMPPVVAQPTPEDAIVNLNFIAIPGSVVFIAGLMAASLARLPIARTLRLFRNTLVQTLPSTLAITFMVGLAYVTRYSGMDTVLGLSLIGTGVLFPFFGTLLGWLGVALTGTDAGSNALFGNLQKVTAMQLGLSPILMGAANSTGGVMGKMIDAQSIVVASTATHQQGQEAAIFKAVFVHSITLACLVGLIVLGYAYLFPGLIP